MVEPPSSEGPDGSLLARRAQWCELWVPHLAVGAPGEHISGVGGRGGSKRQGFHFGAPRQIRAPRHRHPGGSPCHRWAHCRSPPWWMWVTPAGEPCGGCLVGATWGAAARAGAVSTTLRRYAFAQRPAAPAAVCAGEYPLADSKRYCAHLLDQAVGQLPAGDSTREQIVGLFDLQGAIRHPERAPAAAACISWHLSRWHG